MGKVLAVGGVLPKLQAAIDAECAKVIMLTGRKTEGKKSTMDTHWVAGVNRIAQYSRWAFAEFTEVYQIESDFKAKPESEFKDMINMYSPTKEG
ncbi:MAG: hypothetical protein ACLQOO_20870 [Terriglobia bacterium]